MALRIVDAPLFDGAPPDVAAPWEGGDIRPGVRAAVYQALAEALVDPPAWLALPGDRWPLTAACRAAAGSSPVARVAAGALGQLPPAPLAARRSAYRRVFTPPGRAPLPLSEGLALNGHLLGPAGRAVAAAYAAAGVRALGAELPDHAAVELAFLSHCAAQAVSGREGAAWRRRERRFLKTHAVTWLPDLGRALVGSADPVYAPIGALLAGWIEEAARPRRRSTPPGGRRGERRRVPVLLDAARCTLCGFCSRRCPTGALAIDEVAAETQLALAPALCNGCARCTTVCPTDVLALAREDEPPSRVTLRASPRAICPGCGQPTVSAAELDFVAAQIGRPAWLSYCNACRIRREEFT